ncbi:exosome nuclease subunit RRP6 [Aspergillus saccharolyticus JOP 1030-1]|uniref:Putative exosome complex exonuclease Rrp6 n=1 Tax=Aspergillus saccharolyticus JOP 1030-1 TaxID=1450539 RepID=A0A318Z8I7_9EURO|nr:putative exosome complex exonuclease Rrp6 [Aspergillus saccharolyticus JOP 1030-1]PYH43566.1 putative exosome complex exonuclease Rrp6 [Aspergillus saccharolyticus JOP 1030-1]
MNSATDFPPFQQRLTSSLVQVTRTVGQLSAEDVDFHRSSNAEVSDSLDEQSNRLLSLTSSLLKAATAGTDISAPTLDDDDSLEDNWRGVVDVIDALLEKADACLDEFTGVIKKLSPSQQDQAAAAAAKAAKSKAAAARFPTIYDYGPSKIPKPQLLFEHLPDNTDISPFKPLLKSKPHATVPLEDSLKRSETAVGYVHPYDTEIRAAKFPPSTYTVSPPREYQPWESTTATFVDTLEGVQEMLEELKAATEIAIDLEHHDVHSYQGLVSLMQISTRDKDWVVDTLKPWREELQVLNEVFADPSILKVLHGSSMDMIWLQRDLGLYAVNMFDTYHAACALGYPKRSLKFLLQKFVNFEADKKYQMADWRIRPIPEGMFDYARSDTHYLLYVYDHIRNELVENSTPDNNLVDYVMEQSKKEALQIYERPVYDAATGQGPGGWYDLLARNQIVINKEQFAVFKAVHQWRDQVAREEDEGVQCVFPKHVLFRVAQAMPTDLGVLYRTLSPMTPIVKDRAGDLLEVIKTAKIEGADGPEWRDVYVKPTRSTLAATASAEGVASFLPAAVADDTDLPTAVRFETSQFWGGVLEIQSPLPSPKIAALASAEALRLSLPLPPMPRTVSEAREKLGVSAPAAPAKAAATSALAAAKQEPEAPEPDNKYFTIKEKGGPRKRKVTPVEPQSEAEAAEDVVSSAADLDLDLNDKPSKKQRRKEKKNKAAQNQQPEAKEEAKEEEAPFDYEGAASMLNANPIEEASRPRRKKQFNPYAKALEAPSGVRKQKRETAGRTATFR